MEGVFLLTIFFVLDSAGCAWEYADQNSLAMAELHIAIAAVFLQFDMELFETDESDVEMEHAYLVPYPKWESKGVRVTLKRRLV